MVGHTERLRVIWGQCCLRVAAGPCLPKGPITQLSPYFNRNPCMGSYNPPRLWRAVVACKYGGKQWMLTLGIVLGTQHINCCFRTEINVHSWHSWTQAQSHGSPEGISWSSEVLLKCYVCASLIDCQWRTPWCVVKRSLYQLRTKYTVPQGLIQLPKGAIYKWRQYSGGGGVLANFWR